MPIKLTRHHKYVHDQRKQVMPILRKKRVNIKRLKMELFNLKGSNNNVKKEKDISVKFCIECEAQ